MELWESGDPLCVVPYPALDKPDGYELDLAYLETFIAFVWSLDRCRTAGSSSGEPIYGTVRHSSAAFKESGHSR